MNSDEETSGIKKVSEVCKSLPMKFRVGCFVIARFDPEILRKFTGTANDTEILREFIRT